jgi:acetyl-CoA/propionyl-CoA carboxylase biotin carboxyl carrier protein
MDVDNWGLLKHIHNPAYSNFSECVDDLRTLPPPPPAAGPTCVYAYGETPWEDVDRVQPAAHIYLRDLLLRKLVQRTGPLPAELTEVIYLERHSRFVFDDELYASSKAILKEVGYVGAGTCEFLIGADGTVSFLEVNTRLQVEHPVSEEVTGIDLVREQFRLAEGGVLDYADPVITGHSFEFRINGEDAGRNFMPAPGPVHEFKVPGGPGVRVDTGVTAGDVISGSFDSMIAKLIVTGATRAEALERSRRALDEFEVHGLPTVLPFHRAVVNDPAFAPEGDAPFTIYTSWIETEWDNTVEPWSGESDEVIPESKRRGVTVEVDGRRIEVSLPAKLLRATAGDLVTLGPAPKRKTPEGGASGPSGSAVKAPMQATVVKVAVTEGQKVVKGDQLLVLEAMKMEQSVAAHKDGIVTGISAPVGETVSNGHLLLTIEDA